MEQRAPMAGNFRLMVALLALCAAAKPILYDTLDPDCFWHLRVADQIALRGAVPLVDDLSFASVRTPWSPYSWLAELGMKALWGQGGFRAAVATHALLNAMFVLLLAGACTLAIRRNEAASAPIDPSASSIAVLLVTACCTLICLPYFSFRPVMLALVLLAGIGLLLQQHDRARWVWLSVPLTALLANIHLFAAVVPIWTGLLWLGRRIEGWHRGHPSAAHRETFPAALLCMATFLACLLTPLLPGVVRTAIHYQFFDPMVAGPALAEMQPLWRGPFGLVSASLVLLMLALALRSARERTASDWLLIATGLTLLLSKGRYAPLFAIIAGPTLARGTRWLPTRILEKPILRPALACVLALGMARIVLAFPAGRVTLDEWLTRHGPDCPSYPVAAAAMVEQSVPRRTGHVFNEFNWGGYLAWRLGPAGYKVLMDGRTQLYAPEFWRTISLGSDLDRKSLLASMNADVAILPLRNSRFAETLAALGWQTTWSDQFAQVLLPPGSSAMPEASAAISD